MWIWSLGQEDPLQEGTATRCSILAWRIRWTEEPGGLQAMGSQRVRHDGATNTDTMAAATRPISTSLGVALLPGPAVQHS